MDNEAGTGGERIKTDELTALLRLAGVTADIRQREAIRDVLATTDTLANEDIAEIVAVVLARPGRQQQRVRATVAEWLGRDAEKALPEEPPMPGAEAAAKAERAARTMDEEEPAPSLTRVIVEKARARRDWSIWVTLPILGMVGLAAIAKWGLPVVGGGGISTSQQSHYAGIARETWAAVIGGFVAAPMLGYLVLMLFGAIKTWRECRQQEARRRIGKGGGGLPAGPILFDFESVGGRSFAFFERPELQRIARAVPRRRGETPGRRLDAIRTVSATAQAGLPTLLYRTLPEPWPLIVLTDRQAPGRQWNDLPADLVNGLANSGLQVLSGSFPGRLDRFDIEELGRVDLTGLLTQDALLLLVGDGSRLSHRGPDMVALRRLADSGRALWIDEREERDWEPRADAPLLAGLPVCPATGDRIFEALPAIGRRSTNQPRPDRRRSAWPAAGLGDAMGWAAACAMAQPIGVALAHMLRRRFFLHLTANTFGRLVALDGATLDTDGLRFDDRLLAWLRRQFSRRFSEARQNAILDAILEAIHDSGSTLPANSLAHQTWRWHHTRVLLERDPDRALKALEELQDGLLGDSIRRDLVKVRLPGMQAGSSVIPMLRMPRQPAEFADRIAALGLSLGGAGFKTWALGREPVRSPSFDQPVIRIAMASGGAGEFVALLEDGSLRMGTAFTAQTTHLAETK